jgi:hypothetical protein
MVRVGVGVRVWVLYFLFLTDFMKRCVGRFFSNLTRWFQVE